jgi:hypothetical protein
MKSASQLIEMNGIIINDSPNSIMTNALEFLIDDFKFRSKENIIETLENINHLVIDWLKKYGQKTTKYEKALVYFRKRTRNMSRMQVLQMAYNELLRLDNMSPLRGFGICNNFKDTMFGNPETKRISTNNTFTDMKEESIMKTSKITKAELKKVAKELNEELGLEPPILLNLQVKVLKEKCIEAAALIDVEQDEFSDIVWKTLKALKCDIPGVKEAIEGAEAEEEAEEEAEAEAEAEEEAEAEAEAEEEAEEEAEAEMEAEEVEAAIQEAMQDTLIENFEAAKKLVELKELAQEWECFAKLDLDSYKGLQGHRLLRADMLECMPDEIRKQMQPSKTLEETDAKPRRKRVSSEEIKERNNFIESLITAGEYTKVEIIEKVLAKFTNISKSSIQTILVDSKNPKYNKFKNLAIESEDKIMSFKKRNNL